MVYKEYMLRLCSLYRVCVPLVLCTECVCRLHLVYVSSEAGDFVNLNINMEN